MINLFKTSIPFVGGIIERQGIDGVELLIQTRWKPKKDPVYSGTLEFPAGVMDKLYENVYETLKREIAEETGLNLKGIKQDSQTEIFSPRGDDGSFGFKPFCCVQQLKNGRPWIGFIFLCEVEEGEPIAQESEVKNIRWIKRSELRKKFMESPEKFFTLQIPAWKYYFDTFND